MNDFLDFLNAQPADALFGPFDVIVVAALSALCVVPITKVYQSTHRGTSYSQSYIHALFLMALCTAIVMLIIGSNIARAFSLVGALSIIRFRTAVKDVRDTAYLFFAVVVGMGCGTGFYQQTITFTLVATVFMWVLFHFNFAIRTETEEVLKINFLRDSDAAEAIELYLGNKLAEHRLINSIRNFESEEDTHVYVVRSTGQRIEGAVVDGLSELNGVTHAALYVNDQQVNL